MSELPIENEIDFSEFQEKANDVLPDTIIEYTQKARLHMLGDKGLDTKERLSVLDSLSYVALSTKKIKVEDSAVTANKELAVTLAKLTHGNAMREMYPAQKVVDRFKDVKAPDVELVPDEISTSLANFEYEEVLRNTGRL